MTRSTKVTHKTVRVGDLDIFYREAGPNDAPAILLLHGFPTSSQMFRNLIPLLADGYRVGRPGLPRVRAQRDAIAGSVPLHVRQPSQGN